MDWQTKLFTSPFPGFWFWFDSDNLTYIADSMQEFTGAATNIKNLPSTR